MTLLDNELVRCECHQCMWLRASQLERAFIPKTMPSPDKPDVDLTPDQLYCKYDCPTCKAEREKPDAVEEKMDKIIDSWGKEHPFLLFALRDLVALVRAEKFAKCSHGVEAIGIFPCNECQAVRAEKK